MDPYLPVRTVVEPSESGLPTGIARPELQFDGIWKPIPKVSFSTDYNLLPNERVKEIGDRFAHRMGYNLVKEHFNGKQFTLVYMSDGITEQTSAGEMRPGFMFNNSYDKSMAFRMQILCLVEVCKNGMTSNRWFKFHKFTHNANLDDNLEKMEAEMDQFADPMGRELDKFREFCSAMLPVSQMEVNKFNLANLRNLIPRMTANNFGKIMDLYLKRNDDSMWSLLNAGTEHYWHNKPNLNMNCQWVNAFIDIAKS